LSGGDFGAPFHAAGIAQEERLGEKSAASIQGTPMNKPHLRLACMAILLFAALLSCSPTDQAQLQTEVAQAGQTAIAAGRKIAETEAVHLKETAVAQLATQLANLATCEPTVQRGRERILTPPTVHP
jgi:hypothetical protein